jgi:predicted AAA+ superfamily ATPase
VQQRVLAALSDTRVVLLTGPRQAGKTTLAQRLAEGERRFLSLDNLTTLNAARQDPIGFIRGLDRAIIDEIQRVPDLLLAIKESVDVVIENAAGLVVGVEVKAAATVGSSDFAGLQRLAAACGRRFALGLVLHDHDKVVPFGKQLFAVPISALWG